MGKDNAKIEGGRSNFWALISRMRVVALALLVRMMQPRLWPWGLAQPWTDRMKYSPLDLMNDSLQIKHGRVGKIYERVKEGQEPLMKGPETVIFDKKNVMYIMNEEGFLVSLTDLEEEGGDSIVIWAKSKIVADLGMGRPLGGCFAADNTLYIADAHLGLIRLRSAPDSKVELVASRVFDQGSWSPLLYANDVAVGPKTGLVYFTDSTNIAPDRIGTRSWDTLYGSKADCIRGSKTGRLLQYDPDTDEVKVLARGFHFPNGISIDKDEKWLIFGETYTLRLQKYGISSGDVQALVDGGLTGYPDGLDCAWKGVTSVDSSLCYAAMPSSIVPIMKLAMAIPHPLDMIFRSLLLSLPKSMAPPVKPYGGIAVFDPEGTGSVDFIQDPKGTDIAMLTGVTVHDNKLFLGSLKNDYITVYNLDS